MAHGSWHSDREGEPSRPTRLYSVDPYTSSAPWRAMRVGEISAGNLANTTKPSASVGTTLFRYRTSPGSCRGSSPDTRFTSDAFALSTDFMPTTTRASAHVCHLSLRPSSSPLSIICTVATRLDSFNQPVGCPKVSAMSEMGVVSGQLNNRSGLGCKLLRLLMATRRCISSLTCAATCSRMLLSSRASQKSRTYSANEMAGSTVKRPPNLLFVMSQSAVTTM